VTVGINPTTPSMPSASTLFDTISCHDFSVLNLTFAGSNKLDGADCSSNLKI
jgi:hypothetical protein